jgi:hypothetical protein
MLLGKEMPKPISPSLEDFLGIFVLFRVLTAALSRTAEVRIVALNMLFFCKLEIYRHSALQNGYLFRDYYSD